MTTHNRGEISRLSAKRCLCRIQELVGKRLTFFCRRTTLVHFFSRRPSYFLRVTSSNSSPIESSVRRAVTVSVKLQAVRYAMMDLWLEGSNGARSACEWFTVLIEMRWNTAEAY